MADMFKKIKKQNGERFAKAIRAYDNGIFDIENLDQIVKYAGRDAEQIMDYLISLKGVKIAEHTVSKTPLQLLDEAGYDAYYADTLEKQNAISHYYADAETLRDLANRRVINHYAERGEKLCTFGDPHRFEKYYIINAVRKDVDEIRREDFPNPAREDKYGTSVLSIQVLKTGGFISIKNRYNHTVQNPDNTLNSNPDNIIPGLSMAIKQHFNVDFSAQKAYLPRGYIYINDKLIKYKHEENNIYVGDSFYVKDGEVTELNKDYQEMIEYRFILDKKISTITDIIGSDDSFVQVLQNEIASKKISVSKDKESDTTKILVDGQELCTMQSGKITHLNLWETTELPDNFLSKFKLDSLQTLNATKLKRIGDHTFNGGASLEMIEHRFILDKKKSTITDIIGSDDSFVQVLQNEIAGKKISVSKDKKSDTTKILVDGQELCTMQSGKITHLNLLETTELSDNFLSKFKLDSLQVLNAPKLKRIGNNSFDNVHRFKMNLPELEEIGNNTFAGYNPIDIYIHMPKIRKIGENSVVYINTERLTFDYLEEVGNNSLHDICANYFPKLKKVGDNFCDMGLGHKEELYVPELEEVGDNCFANAAEVEDLNFPKLRIAGENFLRGLAQKSKGRRVNLPNLEQVGDNFMCGGSGWGVCKSDYSLDEFNAPKLKTVGKNFMKRCTDIGQMNMPSEVNVQVETHEVEVKTFMPKMPEDKRPKPIALEPRFQLVFDESSTPSQENHTEEIVSRIPSVIEINIPSDEVVSKSESVDNVMTVIDEPRVPQVQPLEKSQKSMGLKNRLYELSEKGRLARMIDTVKGLFSKHRKNQR